MYATTIRKGMRGLLAAAALTIVATGTALAGSQALWVANGANVVEFGTLPMARTIRNPR